MFMFFFGPALLLEGEPLAVVQAIVMALIGVFAIASGIVGYLRTSIPLWLRLVLILIGVMMIYQGIVTDIIGITAFALIYLLVWLRSRKTRIPNAVR